jgi:hypothetical protein
MVVVVVVATGSDCIKLRTAVLERNAAQLIVS